MREREQESKHRHTGAGIWFGKYICPYLLGIVKEVPAVDCDCNVNKSRVQRKGEYVSLNVDQLLRSFTPAEKVMFTLPE